MIIEVGKFYRCRNGRKAKCREAGSEWHGPNSFMMIDVESEFTFSVLPDGREDENGESKLDIVAEWVEPADEIEWGEWGPADRDNASDTYMLRKVNGVIEVCYPVKREPVVVDIEIFGEEFAPSRFVFGERICGAGDSFRITFQTRDGKPDWSTIRGEDL